MTDRIIPSTLIALLTLFSGDVMAYIGPGAGIPVLGSLLGILSAIILAIAAIVIWPVRRMLKKKRQQQADLQTEETDPS